MLYLSHVDVCTGWTCTTWTCWLVWGLPAVLLRRLSNRVIMMSTWLLRWVLTPHSSYTYYSITNCVHIVLRKNKANYIQQPVLWQGTSHNIYYHNPNPQNWYVMQLRQHIAEEMGIVDLPTWMTKAHLFTRNSTSGRNGQRRRQPSATVTTRRRMCNQALISTIMGEPYKQ